MKFRDIINLVEKEIDKELNIPEVYESDYAEAVRKVHTGGLHACNDYIQANVKRALKQHELVKRFDEDCQEEHLDYVTLTFKLCRPYTFNGFRLAKLTTKIIIVPDE